MGYNFPKSQMKISELKKMGFSRHELFEAFRTPGQKFARKMSPDKPSSTIVFDTDSFREYLEKKTVSPEPVRRMVL
jgi:hypothetical protein